MHSLPQGDVDENAAGALVTECEWYAVVTEGGREWYAVEALTTEGWRECHAGMLKYMIEALTTQRRHGGAD